MVWSNIVNIYTFLKFQEWINSLKTGIMIEQHVALGTIDKMEAIFWKKQSNAEELEKVLQ